MPNHVAEGRLRAAIPSTWWSIALLAAAAALWMYFSFFGLPASLLVYKEVAAHLLHAGIDVDYRTYPDPPAVRHVALYTVGLLAGIAAFSALYVPARIRIKRALLTEIESSALAPDELARSTPDDFVCALARVTHRWDYEFGEWSNRVVRTDATPAEFIAQMCSLLGRSKLALGVVYAEPVPRVPDNRLQVVIYTSTARGLLAFSGTLVRAERRRDGLKVSWRRTGVKPRFLRAGLSMSAKVADEVHAEAPGARVVAAWTFPFAVPLLGGEPREACRQAG